MTWRNWFSRPDFYQVGLTYMFTRLVVNVSQIYVPFFITLTLDMDSTSVAIIPLLMYLASLIATLLMKRLNSWLGRKLALFVGSVGCIIACAICLFLTDSSAVWMYPVSILLGAGNAIIMVTSISMEADMIGNNTESGAFVYGALSFTDKLSNGIVVLIIQIIEERTADEDKNEFYRIVTAGVPLAAAIVSAIIGWTVNIPEPEPLPSRTPGGKTPRPGGSGSGGGMRRGGSEGGLPLAREPLQLGPPGGRPSNPVAPEFSGSSAGSGASAATSTRAGYAVMPTLSDLLHQRAGASSAGVGVTGTSTSSFPSTGATSSAAASSSGGRRPGSGPLLSADVLVEAPGSGPRSGRLGSQTSSINSALTGGLPVGDGDGADENDEADDEGEAADSETRGLL